MTVLWVLVTYLTLHLSNMESLSIIICDMLLLCSTGMTEVEGRSRRGRRRRRGREGERRVKREKEERRRR